MPRLGSHTEHHRKYYQKSLMYKTKCKCPDCGKEYTVKMEYPYAGRGLARYTCYQCKVKRGEIYTPMVSRLESGPCEMGCM